MVDFSDLAASRGVAVAEAVGRFALTSGSALRPFLPHSRYQMRRWATVAAFITIAGCSSFGGDTQHPAQDAAAKQAAADAAKASGEAAKASGEAAATQSASAAASSGAATAGVPDINSVPKSAPVPADLDAGVQPGLSADRTNAQYTDESLTAPGEAVARPAAPVAATPPAPTPAPLPAAATAPAGTPAPQIAGVTQQPLTPPVVGQYPAPQMTQVGTVSQGYVGTPQPGSKPLGGGTVGNGYIVQPGAVPQASAPTVVATPVMVDYSSVAAGGTYGYASYSPYQRNNPAQAYYRSPYGVTQPVAYGGAALQPGGFQPYAQPGYQSYAPAAVPPLPAAGQPVGVVFFNNGSAKLGRDDQRVVKQIAEMHRYYGGVVRIVGHASQRTGNMNPYAQDQVNYAVSMKRANAIARALTRRGVPAGLIQVAAAGSANPVAVETMPVGEANNRRVEIYLSAY
ncbi:OmpA family protein [Dongia rigui]|uniref:OmpA family protein n=1 Tax=Dongia rigui TaxID=940149 RepID=A0ABU5E5K1_9PROT|nr:OmpA family protein [Dongia rigui]MDY0874474.1 OmpA family protein [Dongia rigui]